MGLVVVPFFDNTARINQNKNEKTKDSLSKDRLQQYKMNNNNQGMNNCTKNYLKINKNKVKIKKEKNEKLINLLKKTKEFLKKHEYEYIERKLMLQSNEIYYESSFASNDVACLYFKVLPIEGPFIIIPCLEKRYSYDDIYIIIKETYKVILK